MLLLLLLFQASADQPKFRPSDAERGETIYRKHCVQCHGARNKGDGSVAQVLLAPVPDLEGRIEPKDPQLTIVLFGQGHMPGYEATFQRQDAVRVLKYMKDLGVDKALPTMAEKRKQEAAAKAQKNPPAKKPPAKKPPAKVVPATVVPAKVVPAKVVPVTPPVAP